MQSCCGSSNRTNMLGILINSFIPLGIIKICNSIYIRRKRNVSVFLEHCPWIIIKFNYKKIPSLPLHLSTVLKLFLIRIISSPTFGARDALICINAQVLSIKRSKRSSTLPPDSFFQII